MMLLVFGDSSLCSTKDRKVMAHYLSRALTPTSPSPSPEPVGGSGVTSNNPATASGDVRLGESIERGITSTLNQPSVSTGLSSDRYQNTTADAIVAAGDGTTMIATMSSSGGGGGAIQDEGEIARQVLEEKIRIGVDDLMQLAMCAGDVQPGDEEIVRMKM